MNIYPLTILYDAACPVCALEMAHLRQRDVLHRLVLVDVSAPGFDARRYGCSAAELDAEIHAFCADGRPLIGLAALRAAYAAVGLSWVLGATGWGPLRPWADRGYRWFARHRQAISAVCAPFIRVVGAWRARRVAQQMQQCRAGACRIGPEPHRHGD